MVLYVTNVCVSCICQYMLTARFASTSSVVYHGTEEFTGSPLSVYEEEIRKGNLQKDDLQVKVMQQFQHLHEELKHYNELPATSSAFTSWVCICNELCLDWCQIVKLAKTE